MYIYIKIFYIYIYEYMNIHPESCPGAQLGQLTGLTELVVSRNHHLLPRPLCSLSDTVPPRPLLKPTRAVSRPFFLLLLLYYSRD